MAWSDAARAAALEARRRKMREKPQEYGNRYYQVRKPITAYVQTGLRPSNEYYGASQIYRGTYKRVRLRKGNEVHSLYGGIFAVSMRGRRGIAMAHELGSKTVPASITRGAFERVYTPPHEAFRHYAAQLSKSGVLRELSKPTVAIKYKNEYRVRGSIGRKVR